jgi:hypothetical protein
MLSAICHYEVKRTLKWVGWALEMASEMESAGKVPKLSFPRMVKNQEDSSRPMSKDEPTEGESCHGKVKEEQSNCRARTAPLDSLA